MRNIQGLDYKLRANYFVIVIFFTSRWVTMHGFAFNINSSVHL